MLYFVNNDKDLFCFYLHEFVFGGINFINLSATVFSTPFFLRLEIVS